MTNYANRWTAFTLLLCYALGLALGGGDISFLWEGGRPWEGWFAIALLSVYGGIMGIDLKNGISAVRRSRKERE